MAKQAEAAVKAAQKVFDAVAAKHVKLSAAAAKGAEKLTTQLEAVEAVEPAPAVKVVAAKTTKAIADALV